MKPELSIDRDREFDQTAKTDTEETKYRGLSPAILEQQVIDLRRQLRQVTDQCDELLTGNARLRKRIREFEHLILKLSEHIDLMGLQFERLTS